MDRNSAETAPNRKTKENQVKETKARPEEKTSNTNARKSPKAKKEVIPYRWFPEKIRELRKKMTLSQAKFATLLKVSAGTITNWEQVYTIPTEISQRRLNRLRAKL